MWINEICYCSNCAATKPLKDGLNVLFWMIICTYERPCENMQYHAILTICYTIYNKIVVSEYDSVIYFYQQSFFQISCIWWLGREICNIIPQTISCLAEIELPLYVIEYLLISSFCMNVLCIYIWSTNLGYSG